jgi:DNA replication licensing factor MCM6
VFGWEIKSPGIGGIRFEALVEWYLTERAQEIIDNQQDIALEEQIVRKVIRRLMKKDQVFLAIDDGSGTSAADSPDPLLVIHPSYISPEEL